MDYIDIGELSPQIISASGELLKAICAAVRDDADIIEDDGKYYIENIEDLKNKIYNRLDNHFRQVYGQQPANGLVCNIDDAFVLDQHNFDMYIQEYFYDDEETKVIPTTASDTIAPNPTSPNPVSPEPSMQASYTYKDIDSLIKEASGASPLGSGHSAQYEQEAKLPLKVLNQISLELSNSRYETLGAAMNDMINQLNLQEVYPVVGNELWDGAFSGGFSYGETYSATIDIIYNGVLVTNSGIKLNIYRDDSGLYEVTAYILR